MSEAEVSKKNVLEAYAAAESIWQKKVELDALIKSLSKAYEFERIGQVERGVLRFSAAMLESEPKALVISEAIRLTCKFSTKEAAHFVHAIIDEITTTPSDPSVCTPSQ